MSAGGILATLLAATLTLVAVLLGVLAVPMINASATGDHFKILLGFMTVAGAAIGLVVRRLRS